MGKRHYNSLFFADDKDISDLLLAAKQKLNKSKLISLARNRGLVLSPEDSREVIVQYLARLPYGWSELIELLRATETASRTEAVASVQLTSSAGTKELHDAVQAVRDLRIGGRDEVYTITANRIGVVSVSVQYTEPDTSKTRLFQRQPREISISLEQSGDGFKVRYQANDRAKEIVADIAKALETATQTTVAQRQIELRNIKDARLRTEFFLHLMRNMDGMSLSNVTDVKVNKLPREEVPSFSTDPLPLPQVAEKGGTYSVNGEDEGVDDEPTDAEAEAEAQEELRGEVQRVALQGDGLLVSDEYKRLTAAGFFVSHAVWQSVEKASRGLKVEFEAQFGDAAQGLGFSYTVLGVYKKKEDEGHRKSRSACDPLEQAELIERLERGAQAALATVLNSHDPSSDDEGGGA